LEDVEEPTSSDAPSYNKQQPRSSIAELFIVKHTIKIEKQFHVV
jgi:hypothetical protein